MHGWFLAHIKNEKVFIGEQKNKQKNKTKQKSN